jgi:hypothetical protein
MDSAYNTHGEKRNAWRVLVVKPEENGPHRCKWEDNIKIGLREIGWSGRD